MKSYPQYKESGSEIIKQIPTHWEIAPLKFIGKIILGKMLTPEDKGGYTEKPYLRAKNIGWETVDAEDIKTMWFSPYELGQYRLEQNDLLVSEGGEVGRTAIWNSELDECYIQNSVHKVTIHQEHNPRYYLYHSQVFGKTGYYDSIVNRVSIAHLTGEKLKDIRFVIPPLREQQAIANFLDCKTAQIDTLIEKKQRQIDLHLEQRTALINHAVTKGLNPNAPMKDSGVEWLGEIPSHWETLQIKHMLWSSDYGVSSSLEDDGKFTILTMGNIQNGEIVLPNGGCLNEVPEELILDKNDLLFNRTNSRSLVAKVGIFRGSKSDNISFASYLVRFRVNEKALPDYVNYLLNCTAFIEWARSHALPSINQSNLNPTRYSQLSICLPPITEQEIIAGHLQSASEKTNRLIDKLKKEIEFIQEYRTALISEAVTGKIDVR